MTAAPAQLELGNEHCFAKVNACRYCGSTVLGLHMAMGYGNPPISTVTCRKCGHAGPRVYGTRGLCTTEPFLAMALAIKYWNEGRVDAPPRVQDTLDKPYEGPSYLFGGGDEKS